MAPEQANQPSKVDHRADIYSLGVVLFEMLTGELPAEQIQPPSSRRIQVDVRIDEIVLKALEHEPEKRYQTADQFKTRVESFSAPGNSGRQQPPASVFGQAGVDFKSQQMLFGLPWVHVATGVDPVTGKKRIARGIIAIGDVAIGFLALGGVALGGVAMGGLAVGGISLGGMSVGLLALGGLAIALNTSVALASRLRECYAFRREQCDANSGIDSGRQRRRSRSIDGTRVRRITPDGFV
jgi:hypothetical protein